MSQRYLSQEEIEINEMIESGLIQPLHMPREITPIVILKYQLCSEIIKYRNKKDFKQIDLANIVKLNKSEISKICSYQLDQFSTERLIGIIETLIKTGARISLATVFEEASVRVAKLEKDNKKKLRAESV